MKVIAQTAALQEALNLAGSIVAARSPKPVLQCIKLVAKDKTLTLLATDLETSARCQVTAVQIEEEGEALLPAERLNGIVRESTDEETLTIETEKEAVHVRGAGSHFKIYGYDPGEYPEVADFTAEPDFQVEASALTVMINRTLFATAKAHSHYAISGVQMEASAKKLQMVATDGHRLAQSKGSLSGKTAGEVRAIVPGKLMALIQRAASDTEGTLDVKVAENQILIRTARAVLVSALVQGTFPKYADVIPKECAFTASVNTSQFEHRVRQAALLTNEESKGVRLHFKGQQMTLASRAPESGEAEVTCPIQYEGDEVSIGFNPAFLLDALRVIDAEEIQIGMNASNKPAVLKAGNDFLYVLMPVDLG